MPEREVATSRIALLELGEERLAAREGFALLDEKRVLLATRLLQRLAALASARERCAARHAAARARLAAALERHGWLNLGCRPAALLDGELRLERASLLGLELATATLVLHPGAAEHAPAAPSPEVDDCARAFVRLIESAAEVAAHEASLRRLAAEFRRTARRARAIENVLLPELELAVRRLEEALESVDQEEAVRVRGSRRRHARTAPD